MRILSLVTIITAASLSTAAFASDVRLLSFPDSAMGTWASSADLCKSSGDGKIDIAAKTYSMSDETCEISWITVTASRDGPVYSARSMCTLTRTGQKNPPSYFVASPRPDNTLVVRQPDAGPDDKLITYRKCL
jgi:hypothetical protein